MRALLFLGLGVCSSYAYAQSFNGSFEDTLGNYNDSGWVSTCSVLPGPAAPGFGSVGVLVPHSNTSSCTGWSRFYHYVPWIADGETWTLSGWCGVFTFPFFSPYVGLRFGWKDALGKFPASPRYRTLEGRVKDATGLTAASKQRAEDLRWFERSRRECKQDDLERAGPFFGKQRGAAEGLHLSLIHISEPTRPY